MTSCVFSPSFLSSFWCDLLFSITPPILFAIKSSFLSLLVIATNEILVKKFKTTSIYGESYKGSFASWRSYCLWIVGCLTVSFILRLTEIVSTTNQSALTVAVAWPYMFGKLKSVISDNKTTDDARGK